jgi:hypothetical protein
LPTHEQKRLPFKIAAIESQHVAEESDGAIGLGSIPHNVRAAEISEVTLAGELDQPTGDDIAPHHVMRVARRGVDRG